MINWKVRFSNKLWVMAIIAQLFVVVELLLVAAHAWGLTDFHLTEEVKGWVLALVNAIFAVLSTAGVVQDPTVKGFHDSAVVLARERPIDPKN